jgi:hypothetical protein
MRVFGQSDLLRRLPSSMMSMQERLAGVTLSSDVATTTINNGNIPSSTNHSSFGGRPTAASYGSSLTVPVIRSVALPTIIESTPQSTSVFEVSLFVRALQNPFALLIAINVP